MKKILLYFVLILISFYCIISYATTTSRQLYKVVYNSARDCNYWYYVDRVCVGNSTSTIEICVIFGTGTIKIGDVYISTAANGLTFSNDVINGVDISDLQVSTSALIALFNQHMTSYTIKIAEVATSTTDIKNRMDTHITSDTLKWSEIKDSTSTLYTNHCATATEVERLLALKLPISSGIVIDALIATLFNRLAAPTTGAFELPFVSTDNATGVLIEMTTVYIYIPFDCTVFGSYIRLDQAGNFCVRIDTSSTYGVAGSNFVTNSTGAYCNNSTYYTSGCEQWTNKNLARGSWIRAVVIAVATARSGTYAIEYKRKLW